MIVLNKGDKEFSLTNQQDELLKNVLFVNELLLFYLNKKGYLQTQIKILKENCKNKAQFDLKSFLRENYEEPCNPVELISIEELYYTVNIIKLALLKDIGENELETIANNAAKEAANNLSWCADKYSKNKS